MKKHDERFENMRFQARRKYIMKSFEVKDEVEDFVSDEESNLSMVDES